MLNRALAAAALLVSATTAQATTITATQDVQRNFDGYAAGAAEYISVGNFCQFTCLIANAYIQFDLFGLSADGSPATLSVTNFNVANVNGSGGGNGEAVSVYAIADTGNDAFVDDDADTTGIPGVPDDYYTMPASTYLGDLVFSGFPDNGETVSLTSSALGQFLANGIGSDGLATFVLQFDETAGARLVFHSTEGALTGPQLSFQAEDVSAAVPLPASGFLLLIAVGALGARRWRTAS